jgi:hypothetical protein
MENKKKTHGGAGRGQGRKTRLELGLEPTVPLRTQVEQSVIDACREKYGSIPAALRFAATQSREDNETIKLLS